MDTLYTTPQLCPSCGYTLDGHTNTSGSGGPGPGDFTICLACAAIMRYDEGMKVYAITLEEVPEECRSQVEKVIAAVKTLRVTYPEWKPYRQANS